MTPLLAYRFQFNNGFVPQMTEPQYEKACDIAHRWGLTQTVIVEPVFGSDGKEFMINTGTMWIVVLPDGSSHS